MASEKYTPIGAPLTEHEREVLIILMEECAEVIQIASKMIRFGKDEGYPGSGISNVENLSAEVGDVLCMVEIAQPLGLMNGPGIHNGKLRKRAKLARFMQTETPPRSPISPAMRRD